MPSAWLRRNVFHPCEGGPRCFSRAYWRAGPSFPNQSPLREVSQTHPRDGIEADRSTILGQAKLGLLAFSCVPHGSRTEGIGAVPSAWRLKQNQTDLKGPSTVRQRLWVRGARSRSAHLRIFSKKNESDLMPTALARVRRLDCRSEGLLVRVKLACGSTKANCRV
jgi:hypothetical protein